MISVRTKKYSRITPDNSILAKRDGRRNEFGFFFSLDSPVHAQRIDVSRNELQDIFVGGEVKRMNLVLIHEQSSLNGGSILSDASNAPPAQNEPVVQEDEQNGNTTEEQELAAAQQQIYALPNLKILSIMRKALPKDAHIHAAVDDAMRACVAKFTGILTKEAKQQQTLARHKALESEDIINALKKLGFEDSSTALDLFFSRFRAMTNRSQPQQVQLPVHTSELIQTEMQQQSNNNVTQQGITHGDPTSSLLYWGNATMPLPPSPAFPSWPISYSQPVPTQQNQQERTMWRASNPQIAVKPDTMPYSLNMQPTSASMQQQGPVQGDSLNFTPFSGDALFPQSIPPRSDESISQHVPMQMMKTSDSPLDQEMTDAEIAYVLDLLKD